MNWSKLQNIKEKNIKKGQKKERTERGRNEGRSEWEEERKKEEGRGEGNPPETSKIPFQLITSSLTENNYKEVL